MSCTHNKQPPLDKKNHYAVRVYSLIWSIKMKNFAHIKTAHLSKYIYDVSIFANPSFPRIELFVLLPTGAQRGRPMMKKTMEMARMTRVLWGLRVGYWSMTPVRTVSNIANYGYNQKLNRIIQKLII